MLLDFRTLSFNLVIFSVIFGMGMFVYANKHKTFVGIRKIGLGHLLIGSGYMLLGLRHVIDDFSSVIIANSAVFIGMILIYRGLLGFLSIKLNFERYLSPLLLVLLAGLLYYYKFHVPSINIRILCVSSLFSVLCFIAAFGLSKHKKEHGHTAISLLILMFCIIGGFHVFRAFLAVFQTELHDFMKAGLVSSLSTVGSEALVMLTSFATIWLATDRLQNELLKIARTDSLTKLYNRRTFEEYCDVEYSRVLRSKSTFSIIICDLDHFKRINDHHGHQVGDYVLQEFANILRKKVRKQDIVARFGGEEFVILLPDTDSKQGLIVAEHLRVATQSTNFSTGKGVNIAISSSFGVAHFASSDNGWPAVLSRADKALYTAKEQGRNRAIAF